MMKCANISGLSCPIEFDNPEQMEAHLLGSHGIAKTIEFEEDEVPAETYVDAPYLEVEKKAKKKKKKWIL